MNDALPTVTIVMTTYFPNDVNVGPLRHRTAMVALESWAANLRYAGGLALHVADDGSALTGWPKEADVRAQWEHGREPGQRGGNRPLVAVTTSRQERHGVGASLNAGFDAAHDGGGFALYAVDDWQLPQSLDLTPWVRVLLDEDNNNGAPVGMVRFAPAHPWLTGTIQTFPSAWGMRLDRHHYAFGHRPALYHPRMREAYGRFAEDVNAYDCERLYAEHFAATPGPDIVLAIPNVFDHMGGVELADIDPRSDQ